MLLSMFVATAALARPVVEVFGGGVLPIDAGSNSEPGLGGGAGLGWCLGLGPAFVQAEVFGRTNQAAPVLVAGVGADVLLKLGFAQVGPYARLGVGLGAGGPLPTPEAGLSVFLDPPTPLVLGVRAGWQWDHPAALKCGTCAQPSEQWLNAMATVGLRL